MARSNCPICDRKVKFLARKSGAPDNLQRMMEATELANQLGADDVAAKGVALSGTWHSFLHGEYHGTLPFDEANTFFARVDALMDAQP